MHLFYKLFLIQLFRYQIYQIASIVITNTWYAFIIYCTGIRGFQITTAPANGSTIYACSDTSITIPFNFTVNDTNNADNVISVEWKVSENGQNEKFIAVMLAGSFNPFEDYSGRVHVSQNFEKKGRILSRNLCKKTHLVLHRSTQFVISCPWIWKEIRYTGFLC